MRVYKQIVETKNGRAAWILDHINSDKAMVLENLACDLIAKKINECRYISTIKRRNCYDGTQEITVVYTDADYTGNKKCRSRYIIPNN